MKIIYFDVETYEEEFLKTHNTNNYILTEQALTEMTELKPEYLDADIISVFTTSRVTKPILEKFPNLKLIALRSVGFNHIDIAYCKEHNIVVSNSPNYGNITVSEYALALLLNVCRKIIPTYNNFKDGKVEPQNCIGMELHGKTMGIVGLGAIGSAFAKIARGLDMKVIAYDKFPQKKLIKELQVEYTDFDTLLIQSDFISIHAPLTKDNYHMFDETAFKKMKTSAIIINTGRGELIDSKALYNALLSDSIAGAGLDVLEKEETMIDFDYMSGVNRLDNFTLKQTIINSQLFKFDNVIITPHTAYNTKEAIERILNMTMNNIYEFIKGNPINDVTQSNKES